MTLDLISALSHQSTEEWESVSLVGAFPQTNLQVSGPWWGWRSAQMSWLALGGQVDRLRVESGRARPQPPAGQAPLPPRTPFREVVGTEVRAVGLETAGV